MTNLMREDLLWAIHRIPSELRDAMKLPEWHKKVFVGGGYIRCVVTSEKLTDIDVFCDSKSNARLFAKLLASKFPNPDGTPSQIWETPFACTILNSKIQVIHRWHYSNVEDLLNDFDFTIAQAGFYYDGEIFVGKCADRYYADLAAKRLVYTFRKRDDEPGGSLLRVLKFYQRGYRIPLDSFGVVIAKLVQGVDFNEVEINNEEQIGNVLTSLLISVDPQIDPFHESHLPSTLQKEEE